MRGWCLVAALVTALFGCHHASEASLEGSWKATDIRLPDSIPKEKAEAMKSAVLATTAEFHKDKTFTLKLGAPITGVWSLSGNTVELTTQTIYGQPVEKINEFTRTLAKHDPRAAGPIGNPNMTATLSDDGRTMSLRQEGTDKGAIILTKQGS